MAVRQTSWADRLRLEREISAVLRDLNAPAIDDITFRKQSHNAVVYSGVLQGAPVFVKRYETDYGPVLVRNTGAETSIVAAQMRDTPDGVADVVWASDAGGVIVMSAAPGGSVADALETEHAGQAMQDVARWFKSYVGPRREDDFFSTTHWLKKRESADLSMMDPQDREVAQAILALQRVRAKSSGKLAAVKGRVPKDFAPHNLHWTGEGVFGFDLEGYKHMPLVKSAVWFAVLASKRIERPTHRLFGLPAVAVQPFMDVLGDQVNAPEIWPYLVADSLFDRFVHRYFDEKIRAHVRAMMHFHLETV